MSNVVDQRILEMQFDNKQFEQGVSTSLKTLDDLKKGLNLEKSAKSLESLQKAGKKFSLEGLASNVEFVAKKFTALGILGVTAMQRIANSAITTGKNLVSALTIDPIKSGLKEYETQIGAIQTILSNTKSKGSTLDDVNKALDDLNAYADRTIYNFTEMSKNIGTFTAAGVALDTSTQAIKGIANLAAVSGSNAQQASVAMYQLSQALASGTIRLMDWNSVVNAGMGGEVFQNALKETARLHGIKIDQMIKKEGSFRETLQNGWLTASILTETLAKFTGDLTESEIIAMGYTKDQAKAILELGKDANDAATKVKTFSQLMDTLKEALGSGWTQTWENIIGNFEEARDLWTSVSDALGAIIGQNADARNQLLADWKEAGGRDDLLKGLSDTFQALWGIVLAVGDAMREIFPDVTVENLLALSKGVRDFGHKLKLLLSYKQDFIKEYTTSDNGVSDSSDVLGFGSMGDDVKELQKRLTEAGFALEQDGIFGKKTRKALEDFQKAQGILVDGVLGSETRKALFGDKTVIEKITGSITYFSDKLEQLKSISGGVFAIFDIGLQALNFFWEVIKIVGDVLSPIADMFLEIAAAVGDWFVGIDEGLKKASPFTSWLEAIQKFLEPVKSTLKSVTESILKFFGIGDSTEKASERLKTFVDWWDRLKKSIESTGIVDKLKAISDAIKEFLFGTGDNAPGMGQTGKPNLIQRVMDFFNKIKEWYAQSEAAQAFVSKLKDIFNSIKEFLFGTGDNAPGMGQTGKPNFFKRIDSVFKWISNVYNALKKNDKVKEISGAIADFFSPLVRAIKSFFLTDGSKETKDPEKKGEDILQPFFRVYEWIKSTWETISNWLENAFKDADAFLNRVGVGGLIGLILGAFGVIGISKAVKSVRSVFKGLGDVIEIFKNKFKSGIKVQPISKSILQIAFAIGILVAAIYVLGTMDGRQLAQGAITLGTIVGILVTLTILMNKFVKTEEAGNIEKIGQAFLNFAIAIGVIAAAIFVLGNMDTGVLIRGGVAVIAILGILTVFSHFMKKYGSTKMEYKGLVGMAFAIGILGVVAWMLGKMDPKSLWSGIAALTGLMAVLATFMWFVNNKGGSSEVSYKGLFSMVLAVGVMAGLVFLLSKIDWKEGWKGVVALGVLMTALAAFMWFVNKKGGSSTVKYGGLIGMSVAIGILAGLVMMLGGMDPGAMSRGVGAVVVLMGAMAGLMGVLGLATKNVTPATIVQTLVVILGFIALITAFSIAVNLIKNVDPKIMLSFSESFALALAALVASLLVVTKTRMSPGSMVKGAAGLGAAISAFVLILTGLTAGLGKLDEVTNGGLTTSIRRGGEVLREVGRSMSALFDGVREGVLGTNSGEQTPDILTEKTEYISGLTGLVDGLKTALIGLGAVLGGAAVLGFIPNGPTAIIKGAFGIVVAIFEILGGIGLIIWALGFLDTVSNGEVSAKIRAGADTLNSLGLAIGALFGGIKTGFSVYDSQDEYVQNVRDYASTLNDVGVIVSGMANTSIEEDVNKATAVAENVKRFFDGIAANIVNPLGLWLYNATAKSFLDQMRTFGSVMADYGAELSGIAETNIVEDSGKAIEVAESITTFLSELKDSGIEPYRGAIDNFLKGPTANETILDQIGKLGEKMKVVQDGFSGLGSSSIVTDVTSGMSALGAITTFLNYVSSDAVNLKMFQGDAPLPSFDILIIQMTALSQAIKDFDTNTADIDIGRFVSLSFGLGLIGSAVKNAATNFDSDSALAFTSSLETLSNILSGNGQSGEKIDSSHFLDELDSQEITSKLESFTKTVTKTMSSSSLTISDYSTKFNDAGTSLASALNYGVNSAPTDTSGIDSMIGSLLSAATPYASKFSAVGRNFGLSLSSGLRSSAAVAIAMAEYVAKKMLAKVKEVFNINSPSKEGISIGKSLDEGLALGVRNFSILATKASEKTGNSILDSTRDTLSGLSSVLDGSMDGPPVIRPVLDLSSVTSGAKSIGGLFSDKQTVGLLGVQSRSLAGSIRMPSTSKINQNVTPSTPVSAETTPKYDFSESTFVFSDKMDVRSWKMELNNLERDDDRSHGSVY